ncbi:MAG: SUMF1/EgtB/PvdO family nonheme iron enzyme [Anaerolineales bacterium]|nr:SUMF1/EgtB/PvdO family nonheme iron enzyme [Anaerolineales bacterium]
MPDAPKTYIVNDQPTDTDALDFTPYVETLADIIQTGNTPLTIGVFGTWGSGKTSLMKMVKKNLPDDFTVAWFDAWKYDKEETLWRAFLLSVLTSLKDTAQKAGKPTEEFEKMQSLLYREMELEKLGGVTIDLPKLGGAVATGLVKLSLSFIPGISTLTKLVEELQAGAAKSSTDEAVSAITRERTKIYIEQVQFLEQFQEKFAKLVKTHIAPKRLVVFVDDLDRCLPEKAIEVLEAIKLFLDVENCVFVLGLDQEVITRGIEMKYKELGEKQDGENQRKFTIEGIHYLEKIIQLPFQIPPIEQSDMGGFVQNLSTEWPHEECPRIFADGLGDNPRQIKRTVNTFLMLWKLAQKRNERLQGKVKPVRLAKVVAIQTAYPDLYNLLLKDEPRYLRSLEDFFREEAIADYKNQSMNTKEKSVERPEPAPALAPFLSRRGASAVRKILAPKEPEVEDADFTTLSPDELRLYFTLTARAEGPKIPSKTEAPHLVFEPEMVNIPAGAFLMGSSNDQLIPSPFSNEQEWLESETPQHQVELSEYLIGKYLVTNREYQEFIKSTGAQPPRNWDGDQFPTGRGDHPVVNVSWMDALSYCEWLRKQTSKHYRLPTEAEWEKAARGSDALIWPWGNEFDPSKANTKEARIKDTTEVGRFSPQGDSLYGCSDMVGNVWEWCNDWYNPYEYKQNAEQIIKDPQGPNEGNLRIVRGGSYNRTFNDARVSVRRANDPLSVGEAKGFRVAMSISKTINVSANIKI